jgi:Xaa-Pro aminopeptidase
MSKQLNFQDPDFLYLTGFAEPESVAVIRKDEHGEVSMAMLVAPRDAAKELWTGSRAGVDGAQTVFQADSAASIGDLKSALPALIQGSTSV